MARISGVNIPNDKRVVIALTYIFGVGLTTSQKILTEINVDFNTRVKDLNDDQLRLLRGRIEKLLVEGELRRTKAANIKRLKEIKSFRGSRHTKGLPVRGQRSKTNSRTVRGNKRLTMGSGKTGTAQKT
ncbi:30S ribosomal protein S13 [Candidatus Parcubacteria bacterium]|jgi:small subunit ribosomal protein S13|nr:30S ribosomal protein S13 [Candidatus Parcubacteria bacterium]